MIVRDFSKSPSGAGLVNTDIGSDDSRHNPTQRTSGANRVRQPHQLNANRRHVHLIETKYCEDTRSGQQLEAAQGQHANLCNLTNAKAVTLHVILLGVGGTCHSEHTLNQFEQLGLDHQSANQLARKIHAHSVMYANKLVTTRRAFENKNNARNQVLEPGTSSNSPDPHLHSLFCSFMVERTHSSPEPICLPFLN
eukprot:1161106-Pelagomonas_calceolata.AAC.12